MLTKHHLCMIQAHRHNYRPCHSRKEDTMHSTTRRGCSWSRRIACLGIGGLLFLSGYLAALWAPLPRMALTMPVQAAESHHEHGQQAQQDHTAHDVDLAPFMIRNAYHFATL